MSKETILLVDDTPETLALLDNILRPIYRVKVARSGLAALDLAQSNTPSLILLDVMMPGMDGYEVCRRLKADARTRDIPVVFLTASSDALDEQHGLELGAVDYLHKPPNPPLVLQRVRLHLQLRSQSLALEAQVSARTAQLETEIAARRRAEEELQALNETLEERIRQRTQELLEKEALLRETLGFNQNLLMASAAGILAYRADGQCILANPAAATMAGARREQLLEQNYRRLQNWRQSGLTEAADRALSTGEVEEVQTHLVTSFGREIWIAAQFSRFASRGEPHVLVMFRDITEKQLANQAMAERERQFRTLADNVPDNIVRYALDGRRLYVNRALERTLGIPAAELLGKTPRENAAPGRYDALEDAVRRVGATGEETELELRSAGPDGQLRCYLVHIVPELGPDGRPVSVLAVGRNVTEQKEWAQELERRVAERTADLAAANKELEGFTYAASHDLKAPLGRINSFSTLLGQRYRERLDGDGLQFLDLIQQNASRLHQLVDDLLAHSRIGQQHLELQPIHILGIVQTVLHERSDEIASQKVDLRLDLPADITIPSNPFALLQVFRNLVDNALKYSRPTAAPVIEIGARLGDGLCLMWVGDNGIGIDHQYHDRIFEIFRRLHTYQEYPGSGIGLALVKRAIERLGGRIWVESTAGEGATFFLELPG